MYFDDMAAGRNSYSDKQRLNLSDRAKTILLHDCMIFEPGKNAETESGAITSTLVNQVFRSWRESARASIRLRREEKREAVTKLLGEDVTPEQRDRVLSRTLAAYETELRTEAAERCRRKDFPFSFRFDKENFE